MIGEQIALLREIDAWLAANGKLSSVLLADDRTTTLVDEASKMVLFGLLCRIASMLADDSDLVYIGSQLRHWDNAVAENPEIARSVDESSLITRCVNRLRRAKIERIADGADRPDDTSREGV